MKFNVYVTQEISDEERVKLAIVLDHGKKHPKRSATRDEIKSYAWKNGSMWREDLEADYSVYEVQPISLQEEEFPLGLTSEGEVFPEKDLLGLNSEGKEPEEDLLGSYVDEGMSGEDPEEDLL